MTGDSRSEARPLCSPVSGNRRCPEDILWTDFRFFAAKQLTRQLRCQNQVSCKADGCNPLKRTQEKGFKRGCGEQSCAVQLCRAMHSTAEAFFQSEALFTLVKTGIRRSSDYFLSLRTTAAVARRKRAVNSRTPPRFFKTAAGSPRRTEAR